MIKATRLEANIIDNRLLTGRLPHIFDLDPKAFECRLFRISEAIQAVARELLLLVVRRSQLSILSRC